MMVWAKVKVAAVALAVGALGGGVVFAASVVTPESAKPETSPGSDGAAAAAMTRSAEVVTTLKKGDPGVPESFTRGNGFAIIEDYIYQSTRTGGIIQCFKYDAAASGNNLTYIGSVTNSTMKRPMTLFTAGGRLFSAAVKVWGVGGEGGDKGIVSYDIEAGTGRPVEKGMVTDVTRGDSELIAVSSDGKDVYATQTERRMSWVKVGPDGSLAKAGVITGEGLGMNTVISPDGKHLYSIGIGGLSLARVDRKPTGEIVYGTSFSLMCLDSNSLSKITDPNLLHASVAGISPDGRWVYVVLFGTKSFFGIFRRDPATGDLTFQEGGSSHDPAFARFAVMDGMKIFFAPDGKTGFMFSGQRTLLQGFRMDPETGRLSGLNDVVVATQNGRPCRPYFVDMDFKRGMIFGNGTWPGGAYSIGDLGLWAAKIGTVATPDGERPDLKTTMAAKVDEKAGTYPDWPCWRGPNGDGKVALKGIRKDWTNGLTKVWDVTGLSALDCTWSAPSVQGNKLIVLGAHGLNDEVFCFDADKGGRPLWSIDVRAGNRDGWRGGPVVTPCISGDKVYVETGRQLFCLRMTDGRILWQMTVGSACHGYANSSWAWDDLLIVPHGMIAPRKQSMIAAFKKDTGELVWSYGETHAGENPDSGHVTPIRAKINGKEQIVHYTGTMICGLDHLTGKPIWEFTPEKSWQAFCTRCTPVTDGSIVYSMGLHGPLAVQIDADNVAKQAWMIKRNDKVKGYVAGSDAILRDGYLYTFTANSLAFEGYEGDLRCVNLKTGETKWAEKSHGNGTMVEVDGHLLCLTIAGDLMLVEPKPEGFKLITEWKGAIQRDPWWTARGGKKPAPCWTAPVVARGKLYLRHGNKLACYDLMK